MNAAATAGVAPARELTVRVLDEYGELAAGVSVWTWGLAAGIGLTWVREDVASAGLGSRLLDRLRGGGPVPGVRARLRHLVHFQAPGFYERHGYREIFRWQGVPTPDAADVHLRKDL